MEAIEIMIIEKSPIIYAGLQYALTADEQLRVVCWATDQNSVLPLVEKYHPQVIILGIIDPVNNSLNMLRHLREEYPCLKIIVLTTGLRDEQVFECLSNGAHGYLGLNIPLAEIPIITKSVNAGNIIISLYAKIALDNSLPTAVRPIISEREAEVLKLLCKGYSNRQIANELYISSSTVNTYVRRLMDKFNLHSRNELLLNASTLLKNFNNDMV